VISQRAKDLEQEISNQEATLTVAQAIPNRTRALKSSRRMEASGQFWVSTFEGGDLLVKPPR